MADAGDEWEADDASFTGSLARVTRVAENTRVIYAEYPNGALARLQASGVTDIDPGDVVLIGDGRWRVVEPDLWHEPTGIGIVRSSLEGGRLLIEAPGGLLTTDTLGNVPARPGNTVIYTVRGGATEIISEQPVRVRDATDDTTDISRFDYTNKKGDLRYSDFGGYPDVVARARHILETQFDCHSHLDEIGARPVRGVLLAGPPGTGKTHLARVIAAESNASLFLVSGPAIVSKYVGDTEEILRKIFAEAQSRERAIVFFDEIDSIAGERNEGSHEASDRLVAQLLTEMDGFNESSGNVIVLAATNRADRIDPALTRPGRFDWTITFKLPTVEDRLSILEVDAERLSTIPPLPLEEIAAATDGWSGAELASVWTEAALLAAEGNRSAIDGEDMLAAYLVTKQVREEKKAYVRSP